MSDSLLFDGTQRTFGIASLFIGVNYFLFSEFLFFLIDDFLFLDFLFLIFVLATGIGSFGQSDELIGNSGEATTATFDVSALNYSNCRFTDVKTGSVLEKPELPIGKYSYGMLLIEKLSETSFFPVKLVERKGNPMYIKFGN